MWPPTDEKTLTDQFGKPGENLVYAETPYPLRLAWDTGTVISRFSCNSAVKGSVILALEDVMEVYSEDDRRNLGLDLFGGCVNDRPVTGGGRKSEHAWGIAIDWNPTANQYKWGSGKAAFSRPEYDEWNVIWAKYGWLNLGVEKGYDFMHYRYDDL